MLDGLPNPFPLGRNNATGETSKGAAKAVAPRAPTQRETVLAEMNLGAATPEELHARLSSGSKRILLTSIRTRCSELVRMGAIVDSGERGKSEGGCKAIRWRVASPEERSLFNARKAAEAEHGEARHDG